MAGKRLSDEEKKTLILFYKENPPLWDGTHPQNKCKRTKEDLNIMFTHNSNAFIAADIVQFYFFQIFIAHPFLRGYTTTTFRRLQCNYCIEKAFSVALALVLCNSPLQILLHSRIRLWVFQQKDNTVDL